MDEMKFATETEALQHLADLTGSRIKIADAKFDRLQRQYDNMTPEGNDENFIDIFEDEDKDIDQAVKKAKEKTLQKLKEVGSDDIQIKTSESSDLEQLDTYKWKGRSTRKVNIIGDIEKANNKLAISFFGNPGEGDPGDGENIFQVFWDVLDSELTEDYWQYDYEFSKSDGNNVEWLVYFDVYSDGGDEY